MLARDWLKQDQRFFYYLYRKKNIGNAHKKRNEDTIHILVQRMNRIYYIEFITLRLRKKMHSNKLTTHDYVNTKLINRTRFIFPKNANFKLSDVMTFLKMVQIVHRLQFDKRSLDGNWMSSSAFHQILQSFWSDDINSVF